MMKTFSNPASPTGQPYGIESHQHRFAAWAACRAASVRGCRFSVEKGRAILEEIGFNASFSDPKKLPAYPKLDETHLTWRTGAIIAAKSRGIAMTHGVAAKLVNVYLKSRFVCGGYGEHARVRNLHPPIDEILLKTLALNDVGGLAKQWRKFRQKRWSKLGSQDYESVIGLIRTVVKAQPMWTVEEHWKGNQ
jgi:hypothetical protein